MARMTPGLPHTLLLCCGVLAGYGLVMAFQPTHASLRDGWRCLVRYKRLFVIPFLFAVFHAVFTLWVRYDEARTIPGAPPLLVPWTGWQPAVWRDLVAASWLPAAESAAAIFNCAVTTFPLSALWGVLYLLNWHGYHGLAGQGLRRRFGFVAGSAAQAGIAACALAACVKPVFFGKIPWLNSLFGERALLNVGEGINWLSFLFEYLIGVGVQIYLLLLAFTWIRGLTFDVERLRRFSLRRWVLVSKWSGVLLLISSLGINLPLLLANLSPPTGPEAGRSAHFVTFTRWFLAIGLIVCCSVQIRLVFHNETLRRALRDHSRLLWRYGWHLAWFILVAVFHFLALAVFDALLPHALGDWTLPAVCWKTLLYPMLWAALSGWLLASWVCLFRRCEAASPEAEDLVRY